MASPQAPSKKDAILTALAVAVWVVILAGIKHYLEHAVGLYGCWTFTAIILFFALMPGDVKTRIRQTMCGAYVGILAGAFIYLTAPFFSTTALGALWGSMAPVAVAILVIIVGHQLVPTFCNDTAFGYMILSTMKGRDALMNHLPSHFLILLVGGLVAIYGTIWIKTAVSGALAKHRENLLSRSETEDRP